MPVDYCALWSKGPAGCSRIASRLFSRLAEVCTAMAFKYQSAALPLRHGWQGNSVQDSVPSLLRIQDQAIDWTSTCCHTFIDPECLSGLWFWVCSSMFPDMNHYWVKESLSSRVEGTAMVQSQPDSDEPDSKYCYSDFIITDQLPQV
jgi:hypothetical protein